MREVIIFGVDLAHKRNPSELGVLNLRESSLKFHTVTFSEILLKLREQNPALLLIDAPLSLPATGEPWRKCEEKMVKLGFHPLPLTISSMRTLSKLGMELEKRAEQFVKNIFETFPAASFRILGFDKKPQTKKERKKARRKLSKLYPIDIKKEHLLKDELDALLCCLAGFDWLKGNYTEITAENCKLILVGNPRDRRKGDKKK